MRRVLAVILSLAAVVTASSAADAEGQPFFYEAHVVGTNGNPLTGRQTFRLQANIDGKELMSDAVTVEADANGVVRIPFFIGGDAKDLRTMTNVVLTAQWHTSMSGEWVRVGPAQRFGSVATALVANDALILTNEQEIAVSSDLTLSSLNAGTLEVGDIRPTAIANPQAIELGDASGKMTVKCGSVKFDSAPDRIMSMHGPFPATNTVWFNRGSNARKLARVSFVNGDTSPWNSSCGLIYCEFTAPCDCIYEIQMAGAMGKPTERQRNLWKQRNAKQYGRVFLGLGMCTGQQWRAPFDMLHGWSEECASFIPAVADVSNWSFFLQASRRWLDGADSDAEWQKRDNALHIPMMYGETFYVVFYMGPIVVPVNGKGSLTMIETCDDFVRGNDCGAAADTWMKATFNYYPLSADF